MEPANLGLQGQHTNHCATAAPLYCWSYRKNPKISDVWKFAVITLKVEQDDFPLE